MKKINVQSSFEEFASLEELQSSDQQLVREARQSMTKAYAPYSHFHVGAALVLENGMIVKGNNQENASYPLGLCAERVAVFAASAVHPGIPIVAIAVTAQSNQFVIDKPVTPCGACRQAIAEYEHLFQKPIRIIMSGEKGNILVAHSISELLPYQFNGDDLIEKKV